MYSKTIKCLIILIVLGTSSCVEPSPFYGSWADNKGNTFSFFDDNTFSAKVTIDGVQGIFDGNYSILLNVLTLNCTNITLTVVTEWDIRGNILYLRWTSENGSVSLDLYKISN